MAGRINLEEAVWEQVYDHPDLRKGITVSHSSPDLEIYAEGLLTNAESANMEGNAKQVGELNWMDKSEWMNE